MKPHHHLNLNRWFHPLRFSIRLMIKHPPSHSLTQDHSSSNPHCRKKLPKAQEFVHAKSLFIYMAVSFCYSVSLPQCILILPLPLLFSLVAAVSQFLLHLLCVELRAYYSSSILISLIFSSPPTHILSSNTCFHYCAGVAVSAHPRVCLNARGHLSRPQFLVFLPLSPWERLSLLGPHPRPSSGSSSLQVCFVSSDRFVTICTNFASSLIFVGASFTCCRVVFRLVLRHGKTCPLLDLPKVPTFLLAHRVHRSFSHHLAFVRYFFSWMQRVLLS